MQRYFSSTPKQPLTLNAYTCVAFSTDAPPIRIGLLARDTAHAYATAQELFPNYRVALAELSPEW
jgi:hypothetical protein